MITCYIALGSNVGERKEHLKRALSRLESYEGMRILACSSLYETPPWGYTNQRDFLNALCKLQAKTSLKELFHILQQVEESGGRKRDVMWGPRTIDLDIIYCLEETIEEEELAVPHLRFWDRLFVLRPLEEIDPDFSFRGDHIRKRIKELPAENIRIYEGPDWWVCKEKRK